MNAYAEMKARHQERVNALPVKFAFGMKQFREMMESWGLTENDTDKIYKMGEYLTKNGFVFVCGEELLEDN